MIQLWVLCSLELRDGLANLQTGIAIQPLERTISKILHSILPHCYLPLVDIAPGFNFC